MRCTPQRYGLGSWAIVTGASEGIGKASAKYLAKEGFNVVLIGNTLFKLRNIAEDLEKEAKLLGKSIRTRVIMLDYTKKYDSASFS